MTFSMARIALFLAILVLTAVSSATIAYAYCPQNNSDAFEDCSLIPDYYCSMSWCAVGECWPSSGMGPPSPDGVCANAEYGCYWECLFPWQACCAF